MEPLPILIVKECRSLFDFNVLNEITPNRVHKFNDNLKILNNNLIAILL